MVNVALIQQDVNVYVKNYSNVHVQLHQATWITEIYRAKGKNRAANIAKRDTSFFEPQPDCLFPFCQDIIC